MTLTEVAKYIRENSEKRGPGVKRWTKETIVQKFEADSDFTLRARVEAMVLDLERPYEPGFDSPTSAGIARRLREVLGGAEIPASEAYLEEMASILTSVRINYEKRKDSTVVEQELLTTIREFQSLYPNLFPGIT